MLMEDAIGANHIRARVRQNWKRITATLTEGSGLFRRIDADRHHLSAARRKLRQVILKTPQLGVAQRSPVAAVENQQYSAIRLAQPGERHQVAMGIRKFEVRSALSNAERIPGRRNIPGYVKCDKGKGSA